MKRWVPVFCLSCAALLALAVQPSRSGDEPAKPTSDRSLAQAESKPASPAAAKSGARLPNNYGQLGLTPEQRQRIYALQADYGKKIEELEAQLAALREKRDQECEAVLTAEQKQRLAEILKEREQRKAERAKTAKASGEAKP